MKKNWKAFCPIMKGVCCNGFIKGQMPEAADGERILCALFVVLKGKDPQSDEVYDDPGCSLHWQSIIGIETNQMIRHNIASTDKVATEILNQHQTFLGMVAKKARALTKF